MKSDIFKPIPFGKEIFTPISYDESVFEMNWKMQAGGTVPMHIHQYSDEHFKIIKGEILFNVNGQKTVKKPGDEFMVPKGVLHSIINKSKSEIEINVKYMPCADVHKMFDILCTLDKSNSGSPIAMMKYMYLSPKLGLRAFSTIEPAFAMKMMNGLIRLIGNLAGWNKLIKEFKN